MTVGNGERAVLVVGQAPVMPPISREQLLANGEFQLGLDSWRLSASRGFTREGQDVEGVVEIVPIEGRQAAHFIRTGSRGTHWESFLIQQLNRDVSSYTRLALSIEMKLVNQSLSGGGYEGSEYPAKLEVRYRAANGAEHRKVWGFYYQNAQDNRTDAGTLVRQNEWVTFTTDNLMALLPTPVEILSVQISASGHDFESYVSKVVLTGD
jgi:hypothetical protein